MTAVTGEDLTQKEREPPKDPTPINLPTTAYEPASPEQALKTSTWQALYKRLASIRQPRDITPDIINLLNLSLNPNTSFSDLLPECAKQVDVLKSLDGTERSNQAHRFHDMVRELGYSNDQAFRSLLRLADGSEKVPISYARRFYSGLEHMSQYWDTSLDEFYEVPDVEPEASVTIPETDIRLPSTSADKIGHSDLMSASNYRQENTQFSHGDDEVMEDGDAHKEEKMDTPAKMKRVYKGRRTGTGREMQEDYRDEVLRGFMESAAWSWGCQVVKPSVHPRLAIGTMLVPMKQSFVVGRSPKERSAARKGVLEGPVLGMLGRGIMGYWSEGPWPEVEGESAEAYDLLREIGAMLELAQERAREGKEEKRPGAGRWWTTRRRWGSGPGGPMGYEDELQKEWYLDQGQVKEGERAKKRPLSEAEVDSILAEPMEEEGPKEEKVIVPVQGRKKPGRDSKKGVAAKPGGAQKRWNLMADRWKLVQPGSSLWDNQRIYMRIGKEQPPSGATSTESFDNIFLVSSMNHHISILRMRVSDRYLDWLQDGRDSVVSEESIRLQGHAGVLQLWRTKWYDLFDPGERVEAQKGLFQVVAWLMREEREK